MRIVYSVNTICDYISVTTAKCQVPLFGRWCDLTLNAYCMGDNPWDISSVAISFGIRPLADRDLQCSRLDATQDGLLRLSRGEAGHRQYFDQQFGFPVTTGQWFDRQVIVPGVEGARGFMRNVLRGMESLIETIRQYIREAFTDDLRALCLSELHRQYDRTTVNTIRNFLNQIHWRLLLAKTGMDDQQFSCIETMARVNPPRYHDVNYDGQVDIPLLDGSANVLQQMRAEIQRARWVEDQRRREIRRAQYEAEREQREREYQQQLAEANNRATTLLRQVCGDKVADEFSHRGCITVRQDGFVFTLKPNSFIYAVDPQGKTAELCIHTRSFQVNPIDEVIIGYLHIRHKLADYLRTAVAHSPQPGFQRTLRAA